MEETIPSTSDRYCPQCGKHLTVAAGTGFVEASGQISPYVFTCSACNLRTGQDVAYGLDLALRFVGTVDAFLLDERAL